MRYEIYKIEHKESGELYATVTERKLSLGKLNIKINRQGNFDRLFQSSSVCELDGDRSREIGRASEGNSFCFFFLPQIENGTRNTR